jgi:hypothetical protein
VHPMLPIIDIGDFLDRHRGISTEPISMLLLWSMFSVAASVSSLAITKWTEAPLTRWR